MARVPAIGLDFVHPGGGAGRLGALLLIAGALSAVAVLEHRRVLARTAQERAAQVEAMHALSRRAMPSIAGQDGDTPEVREQIQKANAVLAQINVPWDELFAAVETAQDGSVGLLAIQPDARERSVAIGGEARSLPALLAYMGRLQGSELLRDIALASHEIKVGEPGQPVQFVLNARWVEAP
jgi:hypothetical protein